jgi:hypothetical protein
MERLQKLKRKLVEIEEENYHQNLKMITSKLKEFSMCEKLLDLWFLGNENRKGNLDEVSPFFLYLTPAPEEKNLTMTIHLFFEEAESFGFFKEWPELGPGSSDSISGSLGIYSRIIFSLPESGTCKIIEFPDEPYIQKRTKKKFICF